MAEIVNLRRARKARDRAARETEADANRVRFGTARAARTLARTERERADGRLDAHRLPDAPPTPDADR